MEIGFLSHALFKIERHSANAHPREAYGFCLGLTDLGMIFVALPVGETRQKGNAFDRFRDLGQAFSPASKLALSFNMHILAIYHAHSDEIPKAPLTSVPKQFIDKPILIKKICERETLPEDCYYVKHPGKGWHKFEAKRVARRILRGESHPRLVLSRWNMIWGKTTQP